MNLKENECERHGKESVKVQSGLNCQRKGCTEFVRWLHRHLVSHSVVNNCTLRPKLGLSRDMNVPCRWVSGQ